MKNPYKKCTCTNWNDWDGPCEYCEWEETNGWKEEDEEDK